MRAIFDKLLDNCLPHTPYDEIEEHAMQFERKQYTKKNSRKLDRFRVSWKLEKKTLFSLSPTLCEALSPLRMRGQQNFATAHARTAGYICLDCITHTAGQMLQIKCSVCTGALLTILHCQKSLSIHLHSQKQFLLVNLRALFEILANPSSLPEILANPPALLETVSF